MRTYYIVSEPRWYAAMFAQLDRPAANMERLVLPAPRRGSSKLETVARMAAHEVRDVLRLLPLALRDDGGGTVFICATSHYAALFSARIASALGRETGVFLFNFYLHQMGQRASVRWILKLLMRGHVGLVVQSPGEVAYFARLAPHASIANAPLGIGPIAALRAPVEPREYVFSGGYTNRDYELLCAAAARLSDVQFVIACRTANRLPSALPSNVRVVRDASWDEFHHLLAAARLVVLPLRDDVGSSGQMVALAAMQAAKCVIYTDIPVVAQYFADGLTGVACPIDDLNALVGRIATWHADIEGAERIGLAARDAATAFSDEAFESAVAPYASRFLRDAMGRRRA